MKLVTRETLAASALERWCYRYPDDKYSGQFAEAKVKMRELGPNPDPDAIDRIIGNPSWTRVPTCGECGNEHAPCVMQFEDSDGYVNVCGSCLVTAMLTMEGG